jgi:SAM-dependent methyltransferase
MNMPERIQHYLKHPGKKLGLATLFSTSDILSEICPSIDTQLELAGFERVFECFWLPKTIPFETKKTLINELFSAVAEQYDDIVASSNNLSCYEYLYVLAKTKLLRNPTRVLDFGCGTGLIMRTGFAKEIPELIGFDFNQEMLALAQKKGLNANAGPLQVITKDGSFDIILGSYVFHYGLSNEDWIMLLSNLVCSGVLVANFHKGIGVLQAHAALRNCGLIHSYEFIESPFGPILIVRSGSKG